MADTSTEPSRRQFLVWLGGVSVGTFLLPGDTKATSSVPKNVDLASLPVDELPAGQMHLKLLGSPSWRTGITPHGDETDVLIYELEGEGYQMWWPADDEEMEEMRRFYEATRTPGRPNVDVDSVFPIQRSEEEQSFIDAIVAQLDSNEPRLAYAKWLERQRDPLGEFIRLQCASEEDPDREAKILEQHAKRWLLPLAAIGVWPTMGTTFNPEMFFHRGMVQCVVIRTKSVLAEHTDRLWEAAPALMQLFVMADVDLPRLVAVKQMRQIKEFWLTDGILPDKDTGMQAMVESPNLGGLRKLMISVQLSDRAIAALSRSDLLHRLNDLQLFKCFLSASAVTMLAASPKIANVTRLELGTVENFDKLAARRMAQTPYLRQLETLKMGVNDISRARMDFDTEPLQAMLSGDWSNLKELDLEACRIDDEGAKAIANAPSLTNLTRLGLNNTEITDEGVQAIVDSPYLNSLRSINVPHSEEMGPKILARLKRNCGIEDEE